MNKQPFALFSFSFISGILISYNNPKINLISIMILFLTILLFLALIIKKHSYQKIFSVLILISWSILGFLTASLQKQKSENHYTNFIEEKQIFNLKILEINNSNENNKKYVAEVKSVSFKDKIISTSGKALFLIPKKIEQNYGKLYIGNEYLIFGKSSDIFETLNPHQFDYKKYCERKHIFKNIKSDSILTVKTHNSVIYNIKNLNQFLCTKVDSSEINENSKELLKALILGNRSDMNKENIEIYSKAGVMHLIAISGLHITVIFGIIYYISKLLFPRKKSTSIIISLIFVWLFGLFVGLFPSVFRACLMITIYYIFYFLKRKPDIYHSLALSALIILLFDVSELYSIGFQLSFIAVLSIVWLSKPFEKLLKTKNKKINTYVINSISITIAAQLGTLPFVLFYFHQFSLLSFAANFLIIPYSSIIVFASIIQLLIISLIPFSISFLNIIYDFLVNILNYGSRIVSSVDNLLFRFISVNYIQLLILIIFFIFLKSFLLKPKLKNIFLILIMLLIFQFSRLFEDIKFSKKEEFIVFNQYKNTLLGFRNGENLKIIYDKNDDLQNINNFILNSYITNEKIKKIKNISVDFPINISWKNNNFCIINNNLKISKKTDFIILNKSPKIDLTEFNNIIIIDGSNYSNYHIKSVLNKENIWDTRKQGAFIFSDFN